MSYVEYKNMALIAIWRVTKIRPRNYAFGGSEVKTSVEPRTYICEEYVSFFFFLCVLVLFLVSFLCILVLFLVSFVCILVLLQSHSSETFYRQIDFIKVQNVNNIKMSSIDQRKRESILKNKYMVEFHASICYDSVHVAHKPLEHDAYFLNRMSQNIQNI